MCACMCMCRRMCICAYALLTAGTALHVRLYSPSGGGCAGCPAGGDGGASCPAGGDGDVVVVGGQRIR